MKRKRQEKRKAFKDFKRIVDTRDVLYHIGNLLYRRSLRYTALTAGLGLAGYLTNYVGLPGLTIRQAIAAPLVIGSTTLIGGLTLKFIPSLISTRLMTVAQANIINLMEDYRKSEVLEHLDAFWERVFKYESRIRYTDKERQEEKDLISRQFRQLKILLGELSNETLDFLKTEKGEDLDNLVRALAYERPLVDRMEKTKGGFVISAMYALIHPLPQSRQSSQIGFDLSLFEDWRDGAYFSQNDVKLIEQYAENARLSIIKKGAGFGWAKEVKQLPKRLWQKSWFYFITRAITINVGAAVSDLNQKYDTDLFNSQTFLWPGEEGEDWLDGFQGARKEVVERRQAILKRVFGKDYVRADIMLDRMFLPNFEFATDLRFGYDPEYSDGSLDYGLVEDLEAVGYCQKDIRKRQKHIERTRKDLSAFLDYLKRYKKELFNDLEALRAVKIAFHINENGLKDKFTKRRRFVRHEYIDNEIDDAVQQKSIYSDRLMALRLHHQLTIFEMQGYRNLLKELAFTTKQGYVNL